MLERRLLMGMAGIVFAVLSALMLQIFMDGQMPMGGATYHVTRS